MKKIKIVFLLSSAILFSSFVLSNKNEVKSSSFKSARISFKIKGTGSKGISVKIGIGSQIGSGSCCSTVSPFSTSGFSGNIGDVVYDSENKRVIVKIYDGLEGTIIDLKNYY
jgi:hypothetical protein